MKSKKLLLTLLMALVVPWAANAQTGNIDFANTAVKNICVNYWDTNNDRELSYVEAAAVSSLRVPGQNYSVFQADPNITSFNELQYFTKLNTIESRAFYNCTSLTSVTIPNSVTSIEQEAFRGCTGLTSITLSNAITSIGNSAFQGCKNLPSIGIPNSVTNIVSMAFYNCTGLTSIEIPSSVTSIGGYAFSGCTGLTSITVGATTPPSVGDLAFNNVDKSIPVYIPDGTLSQYLAAPGWSEFTNFVGDYSLPWITIETTEYVENSFVELSWNHDDITLAEGHSILYDCSYKYKTSDFTSKWNNLGSVEEKKWAFFLPVANYHYFRIRMRIVEGNNTIATGEWAELERFSINAVAAVNGYPFTLDFEGTVPPAGFNVSGSIQDVNRFAMGTEATTGIAPHGDGSSYLCFHHDGNVSHEASVVLPMFYNSSAIPLAVSFWLYNNSGSSSRVVLEHSSDGENWTEERTIYGNACNNAWHRFVSKINLVGETPITPHVYVRLRFVCDETHPEQYFCLDDISVQPFENYKPYITDASSTENSVTLSVIDNAYENGIGSERFEVDYRVSGTVNWTTKAFSMEAPYTNLVQLTVDGLEPNTEYEFSAYSKIPTGMSNIVLWSEGSDIYTKSTDAAPVPVISFADANVKAICVANWDTDHDDELSYTEAAAVNELGTVFSNKTTITSFDELQYFTGLTSIGHYAFQSCTGLASVEIPISVTSIGNAAFDGCTSLASVTIPNSVTSIANSVFSGCTSLASVTIGNSVASFGFQLFFGCTNLTSIVVASGNTTYDSRDNCNAIIETATNTLVAGCMNTVIPNSVTSIGGSAFSGCTSLTSVTIPNAVTSIQSWAFYGCTGLTSVEIPYAVTSIGYYAFYDCTGLASITVWAETPPIVEEDAFYNVDKSIPVYVPCESVETYQDWGGFTNIVGSCFPRFVTEGNWSEASNWVGGIMPTESDAAVIAANCHLDQDATVQNLSIENGKTLYVQPDCTLYATTIDNNDESTSLVINDGGQVHCTHPFYGTYYKNITGYGAENVNQSTGWNLIAPLESGGAVYMGLVPMNGEEYLFDQMDLYEFEQRAVLEWVNQKNIWSTNYHWMTVLTTKGYLYARQDDGTLEFMAVAGDNIFRATTTDVVVDEMVYFTYGDFPGWNLIGNPYTANAYVKDAEGNYMAYYRMNAAGDRIEVAEAGTPIKPCEGVFVQVSDNANGALTAGPGSGTPVTFTTTAPNSGRGAIDFTLSKHSSTRNGANVVADRTRISFSEGKGMGHLDLMADANRLYIPQGGKDMAVVCSEPAGEMPLNFEAAENGTYTLGISLNDTELVYCHLIDNMTGADIDLLATSTGSVAEYTFEAKTTDYASRFKVMFAAKSAFEGDNASNFAFFTQGNWIIANEGRATLQVIDMNGRILRSESINGNATTQINAAAGIYMLRLVNGNDVKTQKIVVR